MRNIGIPVQPPSKECNDPACPFHGSLSVRGKILEGVVIKTSMKRSVIIRRDYNWYVPKYMRYERRHSHLAAHLPDCIEINVGDRVKVAECRPLSKTVSFVVVEKTKEQ
ncbi:MAG: 30S ribosomal protein S17 [Candidatus Bathyarchaeia archaeon]